MSSLHEVIESIEVNPGITEDCLLYIYTSAEPRGLVLVPVGNLDTQSAEIFQNRLLQLIPVLDRNIVFIVDLKKIKYISSTGFGSLTNILIQCKKKNLAFYLTGASQKTMELMDILGFTTFFDYLDGYRLAE